MSNSVDVEISIGPRRGSSLRYKAVDLANILKAFIGSNYLTIAFSFRQSGLALGLAGIVLIASLTAHCCNLLVKCKYHVIRHILGSQGVNGSTQAGHHERSNTPDDITLSTESCHSMEKDESERKILEQNLTYGNIGRVCMGKVGLTLVNTAVIITQFGFCVSYCIFIGNTIQSMFPLYNCSVPVANSSLPTASGSAQHCVKTTTVNSLNTVDRDLTDMVEIMPGVHRSMLQDLSHELGVKQWTQNSTLSTMDSFMVYLGGENTTTDRVLSAGSLASLSTVSDDSLDATTESPNVTSPANISTTSTAFSTSATTESTTVNSTPTTSEATTGSIPFSNITDSWTLTRGKDVPDLRLLVVSPVLFFIVFVLIRSLRTMGIISFMANTSIMIGCIAVWSFLGSGFSVCDTFVWTNLPHIPIYFGLVTSSFEGIGTILPIEASMEGNRHNFSKFLYAAIGVLSIILASFGSLGYMRFGDNTQQMVNANIPSGQPLSIAVNACLCVGVILTYPLMLYPVVELAELYLFGRGRICGPKGEEEKPDEETSLLPQAETPAKLPVVERVPRNISGCRRNCLRIILVLCSVGLAVVFRNYFAYISAFVGALGSTALAFILPCLFHLKLCWSELSPGIKIKDFTIIIIGVCFGISGIYSVVSELISGVAQT